MTGHRIFKITEKPHRHLNKTFFILLSLFILLSAGLASCRTNPEPIYARQGTLPEPFRRNGMISSSTYQVSFVMQATDEDDARRRGEAQGRTETFNLMIKEPFISVRFGHRGRQQLERIIQENGRIVRIHKEDEHYYIIVYQVTKVGLREELQGLR